jgi:hypothetical protein
LRLGGPEVKATEQDNGNDDDDDAEGDSGRFYQPFHCDHVSDGFYIGIGSRGINHFPKENMHSRTGIPLMGEGGIVLKGSEKKEFRGISRRRGSACTKNGPEGGECGKRA